MLPSWIFVATPILLARSVNIMVAKRVQYTKQSLSHHMSPLLPPGPIIAAIWTILLALMGYATFMAYAKSDATLMWMFISLIALCIAYPIYTMGFTSKENANIGNRVSLFYSFLVATVATWRYPKTMLYLAPLLIWAIYVNIVQIYEYCRPSQIVNDIDMEFAKIDSFYDKKHQS